MTTLAKSANGTQLKLAGTLVPEVRNITDVGFSTGLVDATSHDGNGWGVNIPTLKRGKPITVDLNFVPGNAQHLALLTAALAGTSVAITIILPVASNPTWSFNAFVSDYTMPSAPVEGVLPLRVILSPDEAMAFA
jgi:hypothetical protein